VEEVTDDGKVIKKLIKKGESYKRANEGATVKVAYTARVGGPDGPVFDKRTMEEPLQFLVDEGVPLPLCSSCRPPTRHPSSTRASG
jgi:hypothetical protein